MSETKEEKALRYLKERRLLVTHADNNVIRATCRSDTGEVYTLGWRSDEQRWRCTCPASSEFHHECAHLLALWFVTVRPHEEEGGAPRT